MLKAAIVACALVLACTGSALADPPPRDSVWSEAYFNSGDGTRLHADVFRPVRGGRTPVMLVVSPYLGLPYGREPSGPPHVPTWYPHLYDAPIPRRYTAVQASLPGPRPRSGCP